MSGDRSFYLSLTPKGGDVLLSLAFSQLTQNSKGTYNLSPLTPQEFGPKNLAPFNTMKVTLEDGYFEGCKTQEAASKIISHTFGDDAKVTDNYDWDRSFVVRSTYLINQP